MCCASPRMSRMGAQHGACYGERIELVFGRMHPRHRQPTRAELHLLQKENDGLRTEILQLRHELTNKQGYTERLEVLLRERLERIDDLNGKLEQAREQNKRLEAEAEHLEAIADHPTHLGNILRSAL